VGLDKLIIMDKLSQLQKIREIYLNGGNIIQYLKDSDGRDFNSVEDILISYDFQSGSYLKEYPKKLQFIRDYCSSLADIINSLGSFRSIMEAGIGEGTLLGPLLNYVNIPHEKFGFDISWSRLKFAQDFLKDINCKGVKLFTANLFEIPLKDNSIDIVFTSHAIEHNGGREKEALEELYRVTKKYLVLLEPAYEFANEDARERMKKHGYITNLNSTAVELGYKILEHRLFGYSSNPLNPTGLMVIEKEAVSSENQFSSLVCPLTRTDLREYYKSFLYSTESFLAYPILQNIPCLLKENAIIATHFLTSYEEFKKTNNFDFKQYRK
jgi:SAM-dependent methyltransferase